VAQATSTIASKRPSEVRGAEPLRWAKYRAGKSVRMGPDNGDQWQCRDESGVSLTLHTKSTPKPRVEQVRIEMRDGGALGLRVDRGEVAG
jgi:hypothetical protein